MKNCVIGLVLAMVILLLCGCAGEQQQDPVTTTIGTASLEEYREKVIAAAEVITYDTEPLLEYDPNRDVYFTWCKGNIFYYPQHYLNGACGYILTQESYDPKDIQINIPIQTEYYVEVRDYTEYCSVPAFDSEQLKNVGLQFYQYVAMQEVGWKEIAQMKAYVTAARLLRMQSTGEEFQIYSQLIEEYDAVYQKTLADYETQYKSLSRENIPQFHFYYVIIAFTGQADVDETIHEIEAVLGGERHVLDVGQWTFYSAIPKEIYDPDNHELGIKQENIVIGALSQSPYTDGYVKLDECFTFKAEEDLTITGLRQKGSMVNVLGAQVKVGSEPARYWEMDVPIEVEAGDRVAIDIYIKDDRFAQYEVQEQVYLILDYQVRNRASALVMPCGLARLNLHVWDTYLMAFEGIDIGEYYTCYYEPSNSSWIQDLPESWRIDG